MVHVLVVQFSDELQQDWDIALIFYFLDDPSPDAFVCALSIFALITLSIYTYYRHDRYQNRIIAAVIGCVLVTSCANYITGVNEQWNQMTQTYLPPSIIIALSTSFIAHRIGDLSSWGGTNRRVRRENEAESCRLEANEKQGLQ